MSSHENLFEQLPCSVFWKDKNSVYLGCNEHNAIAAGLKSTSEIIGKTDFDLPWADTEAQRYREDDKKIIEATTKLNYYESLLQSNGVHVNILTSKVPLFDFKDKIIGILGSYQILSKTNELVLPTLKPLPKLSNTNTRELFLYLIDLIDNTGLSYREIDCLSLWIAGHSAKQSSRILGISARTIEAHRDNIKAKISLNNKQAIIEFVYEKGAFNLFMHYSKLLLEKKS
jgi:DNA-binding CsgD family transcriptional regulator